MQGPVRVIVLAAVVAGLLLGPSPTVVLADGGCGTPGRPACTVLRPVTAARSDPAPLGAGDCVVEVGGLGGTAAQAEIAFDPIVRGLEGVSVSVLDYDTLGKIAAGAEVLRDHVHALAGSCAAIHIVAHSMGGVVADRAFSMGLSGADGVATYVPLASPHNGSTAARELCGLAEADADFTDLLSRVAALLGQVDPSAAAICDLARVSPPRPPRGVSTTRLRLVTDPLVLRRDHVAPYRDVRELLPGTAREVEGHGGILESPQVRVVVHRSVAERAVPPDDRGAAQRGAARIVSEQADAALAAVHHQLGQTLWSAAVIAQLGAVARQILEEVRAYLVLVGPTLLSYIPSPRRYAPR